MSRVVKAKGSGEVIFFTVICHSYLGGGFKYFQIFFILPPTWGRFPF